MPTDKKLQIGNSYKKEKLLKCMSIPDAASSNKGKTIIKKSARSNSSVKKSSSSSTYYIKSDNGEKIPVQSYALWSAEKNSSSSREASNMEVRDGPPTTTLPTKTMKKSSSSNKKKNTQQNNNSSSAMIIKKPTLPKKKKKSNSILNIFKKRSNKQNISSNVQNNANNNQSDHANNCPNSPVGINVANSFHTTTSTTTQKRSNTINAKVSNSINDTNRSCNVRGGGGGQHNKKKKKSFLNIIEETDSHSSDFSNNYNKKDNNNTTNSGNNNDDEISTSSSKRTQLSEQIDKSDNDLLCDLISQSSEHQEKKIFNKALSGDDDGDASSDYEDEFDDDDDSSNHNNMLDESDLLLGDEEIEVVQKDQSNSISKKKKEQEKQKKKDNNRKEHNDLNSNNDDNKFFSKIVKMFSPKSDEKRTASSSSSKLDNRTNCNEIPIHTRSSPKHHEIVNIELDGIDIISLPALSTATNSGTTIPNVLSFMPKHRYERILQTMTPSILVESDFESRDNISSKYVAILMEGYNENIRWYVKIPRKVLDNINITEQVSEVIIDVPSNSSKKIDDGISVSKMRHNIAKCMQRGELSMAINTLNESLLSLLKKRSSNIHSTLGSNFHNIGNLKLMLGLYDEAKASYLAAIRARVKKLGDEHPDVVASLHKFGLCLYTISSLDDAQSIFLRTVEKLYKADDCDERIDQIAKVLNNLACIQFEKGDYVSALKVFQTSLNLLSRDSSSSSLTFATVLCNMSHVFTKRGEVLESSILLEQAISIQKKLLRDDHEIVRDTEKSIQYTYSLTKKFKRSKKVTDDLIKSLVTKLPDNQNCQDGKFHC